MLFLHLKTRKVYEFAGLTVIEATMAVGVKYHSMGLPDMEFVRPATEFFDGRFVPFIPSEAETLGSIEGRLHQFIQPIDMMPERPHVEEEEDEQLEKPSYGKN